MQAAIGKNVLEMAPPPPSYGAVALDTRPKPRRRSPAHAPRAAATRRARTATEFATRVASAAIAVAAISLVVLGTVLVVVGALGGAADATDLSARALQLARADGPAAAAAARSAVARRCSSSTASVLSDAERAF